MKVINDSEIDYRGWDFMGAIITAVIFSLDYFLRFLKDKYIAEFVAAIIIIGIFVGTAVVVSMWKSSFRRHWGWALIAAVSSLGVAITQVISELIIFGHDSDDKGTLLFLAILSLPASIIFKLIISTVIMGVLHFTGTYFKPPARSTSRYK